MVKGLPANAGDTRDTGSIPQSGRSPGVGNGYPFQCSCLKNSMDRENWWATVYGVAKSQIQLSTVSQTGRCRSLPPETTHNRQNQKKSKKSLLPLENGSFNSFFFFLF